MNTPNPQRLLGPPMDGPQGVAPALTSRDAAGILFRHKWKVVPFAIATVAAVSMHVSKMPMEYTSEALLMLRQGWESSSMDPVAMTGNAMPMRTDWLQAINSELEILRSRPVLEQAVESIGVDELLQPARRTGLRALKAWVKSVVRREEMTPAGYSSPEARHLAAMVVLRESLDIYSVADSHVLRLQCTLHDPELARVALTKLLDVYAALRVATYSRPGTLEFFEEQTRMLHESLTQADDRLRRIKNELGIASIEAQRLASSTRLAELRVAAATLDREMAASSRRLADLTDADAEEKDGRLLPSEHRERQAAAKAEAMQLRAFQAQLEVLTPQIAEAQAALLELNDSDVLLSDLQRQRDMLDSRYIQYSQYLEQARIEQTLDRNKLSSITPIQIPSQPMGPNSNSGRLLMLLALALGVGGGVSLAFVSESLDQTVRTPAHLEGTLGLPLLLSFPHLRHRHVKPRIRKIRGQKSGDAKVLTLPWRTSEHVDALGQRILAAMDGRMQRPTLIGLTSCKRGEGVSTMAINLAASLSGYGSTAKRTLLIEPDAWRDSVLPFQGPQRGHRAMEFFPDAGDGSMRVLEHNLYKLDETLPAVRGSSAVASDELVARARASDMDYVLFDMPPLVDGVAAERLAKAMDTVILVVESERVRWHTVRDALRRFESTGASLLGAILNKRHYYVPAWLYERL